MKVQCDVCEKAEAIVMCCAEEAALCVECDSRVHAANKLAVKHQRVNLAYPEPDDLPYCDICQDKVGYFFCLEDRALLCRGCDFSIHSINALASKHKRFLVSGTRVALHASVAKDEGLRMVSSSSPIPRQSAREKLCTQEQTQIQGASAASLESKHSQQVIPLAASTENVIFVMPSNVAPVPVNSYNHQVHLNADWETPPGIGGVHSNMMNVGDTTESDQGGGGGHVRRNSISEYLTETIPGWRVDEFLSLTDTTSTRTYNDCCSKKMDVWSCGDADWQADYNLAEDLISVHPAEVPSIRSPPSFPGGIPRSLKTFEAGNYIKPSDWDCFLEYDNVSVVPDIGGVTSPQAYSPSISQPQKRQRMELGHLKLTAQVCRKVGSITAEPS